LRETLLDPALENPEMSGALGRLELSDQGKRRLRIGAVPAPETVDEMYRITEVLVTDRFQGRVGRLIFAQPVEVSGFGLDIAGLASAGGILTPEKVDQCILLLRRLTCVQVFFEELLDLLDDRFRIAVPLRKTDQSVAGDGVEHEDDRPKRVRSHRLYPFSKNLPPLDISIPPQQAVFSTTVVA
jgi:hypothetical protein